MNRNPRPPEHVEKALDELEYGTLDVFYRVCKDLLNDSLDDEAWPLHLLTIFWTKMRSYVYLHHPDCEEFRRKEWFLDPVIQPHFRRWERAVDRTYFPSDKVRNARARRLFQRWRQRQLRLQRAYEREVGKDSPRTERKPSLVKKSPSK